MITYVRYGIANRFSDGGIELHDKLKEPRWKRLHDKIVDHEKGHSDGCTLSDFRHDLGWLGRERWLWWLFLLTTPTSWIQLSPVYPHLGRWYVDCNLTILWVVTIITTVWFIRIW